MFKTHFPLPTIQTQSIDHSSLMDVWSMDDVMRICIRRLSSSYCHYYGSDKYQTCSRRKHRRQNFTVTTAKNPFFLSPLQLVCIIKCMIYFLKRYTNVLKLYLFSANLVHKLFILLNEEKLNCNIVYIYFALSNKLFYIYIYKVFVFVIK